MARRVCDLGSFRLCNFSTRVFHLRSVANVLVQQIATSPVLDCCSRRSNNNQNNTTSATTEL